MKEEIQEQVVSSKEEFPKGRESQRVSNVTKSNEAKTEMLIDLRIMGHIV